MIYDGFTFFNELDLLEIRLNVLDSVVDKFILVESDLTFSGKPKDFIFEQNKDRFAPFLDKIIHIKVQDMPNTDNAWVREAFQRNAIVRGLKDSQSSDKVLISDVDEIPNPAAIRKASQLTGVCVFLQNFYYYYLNCIGDEIWKGTRLVSVGQLTSPQQVRFSANYAIKNAGWHFSYLGGVEAIIKKIDSFSHQEFNSDYFKDPDRLRQVLESGGDLFNRSNKWRFVELDESYPEYILQNIDRYEKLIFQSS